MPLFDGSEGAPIDLKLAAGWTRNYRNQVAADTGQTVAKAHFYGRDILLRLLEQEGCMGIRIYYARDERGQRQLVLVGADATGNDLESMVVDSSKICPPDCSTEGELNS